jgi:hypothetical protein
MSAMREVFTSAIQTLREQDAKLLKTKGDDRKRQEIQRAMVDFFVRACAFEKQGGYLERAVALFQVSTRTRARHTHTAHVHGTWLGLTDVAFYRECWSSISSARAT